MSGRAYARNPSGALGGATDINSIVPHRFRIAAPRPASAAKQLAIRRAIQRRCKEKNWKKVLRLRHARLVAPAASSEETTQTENGALETPPAKASDPPVGNGALENGREAAVDEPGKKENDGKTAVATERQRQQDALDKTKQQLQELEEKLATLSADKHAKFQLLKDLLFAEARAKVGPPPLPKKRRVDSLGSAVGPGSSPYLTGAGTGGGLEGAGLSLLSAPSPSLLRAQSFSVSSGITPADLTAQGPTSKDTRRQ